VHFSLPNTRASAITWSVRTTVFNDISYGLSGTLKSGRGVLFGTTSSLVDLTLQPFVFSGDRSESSVPLTASGLRSFVSAIAVGSTINVSTVDRDSDLLLDASTLTRSDPSEYQIKAVAVTLAFVYTSAGFQFRLDASGSVVTLLTSISALVGSMVFVGVTQAMQWCETLALIIARAKKKHADKIEAGQKRRLSSVELAQSVWNLAVEENPKTAPDNVDSNQDFDAQSTSHRSDNVDLQLSTNPLYRPPLNAKALPARTFLRSPTVTASAVGPSTMIAATVPIPDFPMRKLHTVLHPPQETDAIVWPSRPMCAPSSPVAPTASPSPDRARSTSQAHVSSVALQLPPVPDHDRDTVRDMDIDRDIDDDEDFEV
jgi:hypothetical protein